VQLDYLSANQLSTEQVNLDKS